LFNYPVGIAIDKLDRYLYVADSFNNAIRRVDVGRPGNEVSTVTSNLLSPFGIVIDSANLNLYVSSQNAIYKVILFCKSQPTVFAGSSKISVYTSNFHSKIRYKWAFGWI